ncbi:translation protein SH3-like domain-containing protein [Boeremia exigua]|uniref:translation protein SH3-like domain-containing protein n=1 Tax=Boeremia exigua TaxID=749465 RepID=UPI001E8E4F23|nr:translation protein SH3-like domain-containing protein [Boeremia exigua]KAH6639068.1 translation protein SH3-like domain-containing protein [Boeremia exigua]
MSAAISCTRAAAPRLAIRTLRCPRYASTQAVAAAPEKREAIVAAPVAKPSTATPPGQGHKNTRAPTLAERMHKALYPELYVNGRPIEGVQQPKERKATADKKPRNKTHGLNIVAPAPAIKKICPLPIAAVTQASLAALDPTGARTRLFDRTNPEAAKLGDILLVRQRSGDPFAGVCINIRRRGVDTAILLRGQLTRVGVEMWYKVYSPLVEGIEVVQRAAKRARRARLTYMRLVKHDRGSVENVVRVYLRQKASLGAGEKKKGVEKQKAMQGGKKKGAKKVNRR